MRPCILLNSLLYIHMLCDEFFLKYTVLVYITIHILTSDTGTQHASLLLRHTSVNA